MRLMTTIALAALAAATPAAVAPAAAETLDEAMTDAVTSNPALAAQRERLSAARQAVPLALSEALPQISLSADATRSDGHGGGNTPRNDDWGASANGSQLLFSSGHFLANLSAARASVRGAAADYNSQVEQFLINVTTAYADVREAQAIVAARTTSVENLTQLFNYAQAQFDAGVVTRTDVAQAQARLAQARTLNVQAQGQLSAAVEAYQRLVGHPPSNLEAPAETQGLPASLEAALDTAGTQSPVLQSARASAQEARANIWVAGSNMGPRLSAFAGSSMGNNFDDQDGLPDTQRSSSDSVGLRLSWNLFDGGATISRTFQQRALSRAANLDLADAERAVQQSVTVAWTGLASARSAVVSAREQVEAAQLAYQGVQLERETGLRSTIDVLNQEQDLLDAQLALAAAEHDLVVAERQMLAVQGTLEAPEQAQNSDGMRGR
ncbi:MAG TPA: TolC family outer membrane protein [Caulobacterales bacterium]|nr:TolC family outer membrane protein [Caulobacterales bacterium]